MTTPTTDATAPTREGAAQAAAPEPATAEEPAAGGGAARRLAALTEEELFRLSDEELVRLVGLAPATPDEPPLVTAQRYLAAFDRARRRAPR